MTTPRYRNTAKQIIFVGGRPLSPGAEFEWIGWPPALGVEPVNDEATRVADFKKKYSTHPICGDRTTPYANKHGIIYLPHLGTVPVDPATVPADAPQYSAPQGAEFRTGNVSRGRPFVFLAWPDQGWDAENEAARQVLAWLEKHGGDPRMEPSPWNCFDDSLLLPELPELKDPRIGADDFVPFSSSPYAQEISRARFFPDTPRSPPTKPATRSTRRGKRAA